MTISSGLMIGLSALLMAPGSADARPVEDMIGTRVTLRSNNYPNLYVRHRNHLGEIATINPGSEMDRLDATFVMRRGLAGAGVSFESVNYPGHYLRHQGFRIKLQRPDGSALFNSDASFRVRRGLTGAGNSFESVNHPGHYLRHCSYHLFIDNNRRGNRACNAAVFKGDVTFTLIPGKAAARARRVALRSVNYPGHFVRHRNFLADLTKLRPGNTLDAKDSTFIIRPGLAGKGISFESVNHPGHFLRHQGYRVKLHKRQNTGLFNNDASFHPRRRSDGTAYESVNYPGHFLRHCGFMLWIDDNRRGNRACNPRLFGPDTTFDPVRR